MRRPQTQRSTQRWVKAGSHDEGARVWGCRTERPRPEGLLSLGGWTVKVARGAGPGFGELQSCHVVPARDLLRYQQGNPPAGRALALGVGASANRVGVTLALLVHGRSDAEWPRGAWFQTKSWSLSPRER